MLVLTRKLGEGIAIGDDIRIVVMQIKGKQVRLGIKADATTPVHREEVYEKIQEENRRAATAQRSEMDVVRQVIPNLVNEFERSSNKVLRRKTSDSSKD